MRTAGVVLYTLIAVASGQTPDPVIPDAVQGTGLELLPWVWSTFGYPGILLWSAWTLRGAMKSANEWRGVPVQVSGPIVVQVDPSGPPVVVQVHADTLSKFVPRTPTT